VLLVATWNTPCGIAEHSWYLKDAVERADPTIEILPSPEALDPFTLHRIDGDPPDILHLNYQASLHSRWTPLVIRAWRQEKAIPVVVTYHDTGVPNSEQCRQVVAAADAAVVHEPFDDLPAHTRYWRMGVPGWQRPFRHHTDHRPLLGTVGFPFPWKHYDLLAQIAHRTGWDLLLIAPGATEEQQAGWKAILPRTIIYPEFTPRDQVISFLAGCDATVFAYVTHNTGQSAAILQGIAARKPVIAFSTCRQFRALLDDPLGQRAIFWATTVEELEQHLICTTITSRPSARVVALAEQESWDKVGVRYAALYHGVVGR